ncbi:MAG: hypothetical protein NT041_01360 [Candidatus Vogelbacteria bacterium]|nr:hypothetical protein [Candidatus Vogelbacteria bacterium]
MFGLTKKELATLKKLTTPIKIQNFLDSIPRNAEKKGETYMSPRRTLQANKAHCFEGALLAALALWLQGEPPLLFDLKASKNDEDHVLALYKRNGYWGAISKTNHATLRFRDPVYKTLRELALSYFHEYFENDKGKKTLRKHSTKPFDLRKINPSWVIEEEDLIDIINALEDAPHQNLFPKENLRLLRPADKMELLAGRLVEWSPTDPRT